MEIITEEMKVHEKWYVEAREMTLDKLPEFLERLMTSYQHDYGTICHALAAGAVATAWAMNSHGGGGITGFQAGAVMWEFIRSWHNLEGPAKLVDYRDMLYPQYSDKFQKTITKETWEWIQSQAMEKLKEDGACDEVAAHFRSIADGTVPFGYVVKDD